jgi:hypothetical protein
MSCGPGVSKYELPSDALLVDMPALMDCCYYYYYYYHHHHHYYYYYYYYY